MWSSCGDFDFEKLITVYNKQILSSLVLCEDHRSKFSELYLPSM